MIWRDMMLRFLYFSSSFMSIIYRYQRLKEKKCFLLAYALIFVQENYTPYHWRTVTAQQDRAAPLKWAYIYI
jgi:hypothetical protein